MTIAQLLQALFNLGAQSNFWNSGTAASVFWLAFGAGIVALVAYVSLRTALQRRHRHTHPFGHTFSR